MSTDVNEGGFLWTAHHLEAHLDQRLFGNTQCEHLGSAAVVFVHQEDGLVDFLDGGFTGMPEKGRHPLVQFL